MLRDVLTALYEHWLPLILAGIVTTFVLLLP